MPKFVGTIGLLYRLCMGMLRNGCALLSWLRYGRRIGLRVFRY